MVDQKQQPSLEEVRTKLNYKPGTDKQSATVAISGRRISIE